MQDILKLVYMEVAQDSYIVGNLYLAPSEFTDNTDWLGLF